MTASLTTSLLAPFMVNAFIAGTAIALLTGAVGSMLVLRVELFTADALSHVAFTGAMAALLLGLATGLGLLIACISGAVVLALLGRTIGKSDAAIGTFFAWVLGLGTLLLSLASTSSAGATGTSSITVLFGSLFSLSEASTWLTVLGATLGLIVLGVMLRPLIFSSIDASVAQARGVPFLGLSIAFSVIVGCATALSIQAVGALLFVGLVAAPAGASMRMTSNPFSATALSMGLSVAAVWIGLFIALAVPSVPPSSAIILVAATFFALAKLSERVVPRHGS
ncbi:MAG: metal ABC transporter permease [Actinomycetota bacterium]